MSNIIPLGSGARIPAPSSDPTAIPLAPPITAPVPVQQVADASDPFGSASPSPTPSDAAQPSAPAADSTTTPSSVPAAVSAEPAFDASAFAAGFAQLKQAVTDARTALTQDVSGLQAEDEQLVASINDWDARAAAAEDRRKAIAAELNGKLTSFNELDQATIHLEATEALLYPQPAAQTPPAAQ